jgi:hypothetical protein
MPKGGKPYNTGKGGGKKKRVTGRSERHHCSNATTSAILATLIARSQ